MTLAVYDAYDPDVTDGFFLIFHTKLGCWIAFPDAGRIYIRRLLPDVIVGVEDLLRINSRSEVPDSLRDVFDAFVELYKNGSVGRHMIVGERGDVVLPFPSSKRKRSSPVLYVYGASEEMKMSMVSPVEVHFWDTVSAASPHSTGDITDVISESLGDVWREWGWVPMNLVMKIVGGSNIAFGRARPPISESSRRLITLNPKLLKEYSLDSVKRTILHEFAHQKVFDEERDSGVEIDAHGDRFCELLSMVDPMARHSRERCVFFVEDIDYRSLFERLPQDLSKFHVEVLRLKTSPGQTIRFVSDKKPRSFAPISFRSSPGLAKSMVEFFQGGLSSIRVEVSQEANRRVGGLYDGVRTLADMILWMIPKADPDYPRIVARLASPQHSSRKIS